MKKIISYLYALLSIVMLFACQKEEWETYQDSNNEFSLDISTTGLMDQFTVTSRGNDVKTTEEQEIKSLHVFIFDKDGKYLEASDDHRYQGYRSITGGKTVMNIDRAGWAEPEKAKEATIIVVANVEEGTFLGGSADSHPTNIINRDDLVNFIYQPLNERLITDIPESGMPMYKRIDNVDLTTENKDQSINIQMKALMARVDVSIKINSTNTDISNTLPSLTITKSRVLNVPLKAKFTTADEETTSFEVKENGVDWNKDYSLPVSTLKTIYNKNGEIDFTFYTFENQQPAARTEPEGGWPTGIEGDEKQQYKPELADKENSLAFEFSGNYITYNGAHYDVTYTLYLGKNHTDDFRIKSNKQYKNNVTIKGLVKAGNNPEHITFDTRVNINESNPYFVSILRDRTLDCHFNVVPMDVYFFNTNPSSQNPPKQTMKVEILAPDVVDWVRMERIPAENMQYGTVPSKNDNGPDYLIVPDANGTWNTAGNGKRKYFTADLVTNTLSGNKETMIENHRDRIYFYIDENLEVWKIGDSRDNRTRTATIKLTYFENGVEKGSRELVLEQSKLLQVPVGNDKYIYIEAYEEYLSHGDPLDEYANSLVYTGLPWGANGISIGENCSENYWDGLKFTQKIITHDKPLSELTLNTRPDTAAGYCFIKNKRDDNMGSVSNPKWYLPGIRELETILKYYYLEYTEFQNYYYWSSAAGLTARYWGWPIKEWSNTGENAAHARATKAYITENNSFAYYPSSVGDDGNSTERPRFDQAGGHAGNSGRALRTEVLRIRAARIDNLK